MSLILSGTDGLSDVDGSAATPAIRGTDANTGIFFPAADTIAFSEGGAEIARFDSSGNLGIGNTSPSVKLDIVGANNGSQIRFGNGRLYTYSTSSLSGFDNALLTLDSNSSVSQYAWAVGGSEKVRIDSSGNVGIGTASPANKLDVQGVVSALYSFESTGAVQANSANKIAMSLESASVGRIAVFGTDSSTFGTTVFSRAKSTGGTTESMRIDTSGNLLVGGTTNTYGSKLVLYSSGGGNILESRQTGSGGQYHAIYMNSNGGVGSIQTSGSSTSYVTSSDYRLKEAIAPMTGALAKVSALKPVTYKWKVDGSDGQGFIAHELQEVVAGCVTGEKDEIDTDGNPVYQGIDTSFLVATLTAAIKEQQAIITQLQADVAALKAPQGTP